jgi:protein disulfide-isomerase
MQQSVICQGVLIALISLGLPSFTSTQRRVQPNFPPSDSVDFPPSDPPKDIAKALDDGAKDGKHVLLDFGADWCVDCKVFENIFRDPAVAKFIDDHFHVVRIDLGVYFESDKIRNADTAAKYGVGEDVGIPALVLLDSHGVVVQPTETVRWRTARLFTAPEVLNYLRHLADAR